MEATRPRARARTYGHVAAPDQPQAGCWFLPAEGSGQYMGVRDSAGGPGPPAVLAKGYHLRDTWRHRTLPKRGAGPAPFAGRVGLRTTGVRLLGRQVVVKDNYETLA